MNHLYFGKVPGKYLRLLSFILVLTLVGAACACQAGNGEQATRDESQPDGKTAPDANPDTAEKTDGPTPDTEPVADTDGPSGETDTVGTEAETDEPFVLTDERRAELLAAYAQTANTAVLPIGGWATPASDLRDVYTEQEGSYDRVFQLIADCGINYMITLEEWSSANWTQDSLASASRAGMKLWYNCAGMGAGADLEKINAILASEYASALGAIYIKDEPNLQGIDEVAEEADGIRAGLGDVEIPMLANLFPTYVGDSSITKDYSGYVRKYIEQVRPSAVMFDYYPFQGSSGSMNEMLLNILKVKQPADEAGIPMYAYLQSTALAGGRVPTAEEMLLDANVNLCAGVKGFAYFLVCETYQGWGYTNLIDYAGNKTEQYDNVRQVNQRLSGMQGVYLNYDNKGLMEAGISGLSRTLTRAKCPDLLSGFGHLTSAEDREGRALIGCFENGDGEKALFVTNYDSKKACGVTLHFDEPVAVWIWTENGLCDLVVGDAVQIDLAGASAAFAEIRDISTITDTTK